LVKEGTQHTVTVADLVRRQIARCCMRVWYMCGLSPFEHDSIFVLLTPPHPSLGAQERRRCATGISKPGGRLIRQPPGQWKADAVSASCLKLPMPRDRKAQGGCTLKMKSTTWLSAVWFQLPVRSFAVSSRSSTLTSFVRHTPSLCRVCFDCFSSWHVARLEMCCAALTGYQRRPCA